MARKNRKAQSILEYTLVVGAVIAVLIMVIFGGSKTSGVKNKIYRTYSKASNAVNTTEADVKNQGIFNNVSASDMP